MTHHALEHRLNRPGRSRLAGIYAEGSTQTEIEKLRDRKVRDLLELDWEIIHQTGDEIELSHPDQAHTSLYRVIKLGP